MRFLRFACISVGLYIFVFPLVRVCVTSHGASEVALTTMLTPISSPSVMIVQSVEQLMVMVMVMAEVVVEPVTLVILLHNEWGFSRQGW